MAVEPIFVSCSFVTKKERAWIYVKRRNWGDSTKRTTEYVKGFFERSDQRKTRQNSITARFVRRMLPEIICFVVEIQCFS